jgi:FMS-like tyrosine kinase 1
LFLTGLIAIPIPVLISIGFVVLIVVVIILIYFQRERKRSIRFKRLLEGNPERIDVYRALNEQAHLLPYKKEFEFPRKMLEVGMKLGGGAFGEVHKGVACGILSCDVQTNVAVKTVNDKSDVEVGFI